MAPIVLLPTRADRYREKSRARRISAAAVVAHLAFVVCYEFIQWVPAWRWVVGSHTARGQLLDVAIGVTGVFFAWMCGRRYWWPLVAATAWCAVWMLLQVTPWWVPHLGAAPAERRWIYLVAHLGFAVVVAGTLAATVRVLTFVRDERSGASRRARRDSLTITRETHVD